MAQWLKRASQEHDMYCRPTVRSGVHVIEPGQVSDKLDVCSTSAYVVLEPKIYEMDSVYW